MKEKKLTIELLREKAKSFDAREAIKLGLEFIELVPRQKAPVKPFLSHKATAQEARFFADAMDKYEMELFPAYKKEKEATDKIVAEYNKIIHDFMKEESGLNELPESNRQKVWDYAWAEGHSSGYIEVYNKLVDLVCLF